MTKIRDMFKTRTIEELLSDLIEAANRNEPEMVKIKNMILEELTTRYDN